MTTDITYSVHISYKGQIHTLNLPPNATFAETKAILAERFSLPVEFQKLIVKGKSAFHDGDSIESIGLRDGSKAMLVGTSAQSVQSIQDASARAVERAKRDAAAQRTVNKRGGAGGAQAMPSRFGSIETLPEFADPAAARALLTRLSNDPAIRQIMASKSWSVGVLMELHPQRDALILGYNRNRGHSIALRLRTDALDGFRHYPEVVKVLLHELAHMVHDEHDGHFHQLNRELNVLYKKYSGRPLGSRGAVANTGWQSEEAVDAPFEGGSFTLGGKAVNEGRSRRDILADAADRRLTKEEIAMDASCGSSGAHQTT
ncbi:hypothetical protein HDU87_007326 [Geranomyces variabilis]|uniref:WLM-domain-containing protein n=1 Tax=Geranomyces variabilis TaxID=109894 RepID=A0AAD5TE04_9FUNG|nr:hypothetical protein HDU87_007326 [Geranomyces variabilis]